MHGQMEFRVVIFHRAEEFIHADTVQRNSSTLISVDSSSRISRFRASSGVSPASIFPPGNSHQSFHSPYPRCVANILSSLRIIAATTSICFIIMQFLSFVRSASRCRESVPPYSNVSAFASYFLNSCTPSRSG